MSAGTWWATTALSASYVKHLMGPGRNPTVSGRAALCGEYHRQWQLAEAFERPQAFTACSRCEAVARGK